MVDNSVNFHYSFASRGGVMEPSGICEIKFKRKDLVKTMKRLDEKYGLLYNASVDPGRASDVDVAVR